MFFSKHFQNKVAQILASAKKRDAKITVAESCTGGLLAALLTEISGSSAVFERGFVVYSNQSKIDLLNVKPQLLESYGAVSAEVARAMAIGALQSSQANVAVAITGIAGPDGGSSEKPVGLVYVAIGCKKNIVVRKFNFAGDRAQVRESTIKAVLEILNFD